MQAITKYRPEFPKLPDSSKMRQRSFLYLSNECFKMLVPFHLYLYNRRSGYIISITARLGMK